MSDHIESRMNFIVEQQALAVGIQKLQEAQACTAGDIKKLEEVQARTDGMLRSLVEVNLSLTPNLQALGEETDRRFRDTDYKLNALIAIVDKLAKRNGSPS